MVLYIIYILHNLSIDIFHRFYDVNEPVYHAFETSRIFVSHQWLSFTHPDPEGAQASCLRNGLRNVIEGTVEAGREGLLGPERHGFQWLFMPDSATRTLF